MLKGSIILCAILALSAAQAVAQQTQQPQGPPWYGPGPWAWGDGYSWSFWWICPLMMVAMMLAMMFACRFMCSRHRD